MKRHPARESLRAGALRGGGGKYLEELRGMSARLGFRVSVSGSTVTAKHTNWGGLGGGEQRAVARCVDDLRTHGNYRVNVNY